MIEQLLNDMIRYATGRFNYTEVIRRLVPSATRPQPSGEIRTMNLRPPVATKWKVWPKS